MQPSFAPNRPPPHQVAGGSIHIPLSGAQTVQHAPALKASLLHALAEKKAVAVNLDDVETIDALVLQLLVSAQLTAQHAGVALNVTCNSASPAAQMMRAIGVLDSRNIPTGPNPGNWIIQAGDAP